MRWVISVLIWLAASIPVESAPDQGVKADAMPLPSGPLVSSEGPKSGRWTAVCTYPGAESEQALEAKRQEVFKQMSLADPEVAKQLASNPAATRPKPRIQKLTVSKSGEIKQEIVEYSSGQKSERWITPTATVQWDPFLGRYLFPSIGPAPKEEDFPEFGWISATSYKGIKRINDRQCIIFESRVDKLAVENPREFKLVGEQDRMPEMIDAMAAIDIETRFPVTLRIGDQLREYSFLPLATPNLAMPPAFALELQKVKEKIQSSLPRPSRP